LRCGGWWMVVVFCEERSAWLFRVAKFSAPCTTILSPRLFTDCELILVVFSQFKLGYLRFYPVAWSTASESSHLESYMHQPASQSTSPSVNRQLDDPSKWLLTPSLESILQSCPMPDNSFAMAPFLRAFHYEPCIEE
jgi:hypothetical protein